eukprot:2263579-Rhodomonas_salina.1
MHWYPPPCLQPRSTPLPIALPLALRLRLTYRPMSTSTVSPYAYLPIHPLQLSSPASAATIFLPRSSYTSRYFPLRGAQY